LENAIERACILSDTMMLEARDLGFSASRAAESESLQQLDLSGSLSDVGQRALRLVERRKIVRVLEENLGNKSKTAEDLGVSYKTLLNKMKEYAL
jgi:DNA-binding NtrC family response regulator